MQRLAHGHSCVEPSRSPMLLIRLQFNECQGKILAEIQRQSSQDPRMLSSAQFSFAFSLILSL